MPRYSYIARDSSGRTYRGGLEAVDEREVREKLRGMGFYITSIKREKFAIRLGKGRVVPDDLVAFSRQFSTMIGAGLPLTKSLRALEKQTENPALKRLINEVRIDIEGGTALSDAMAKHPSVFSEFFVALIKAGEAGGVLPKVLERLANHLEKQHNLKRTVRSAFAYPMIVGTLAILVMTFLVVVIVPVFKGVYARLRLSLPGPTLALIGVSNFIRDFWWLILLVIGGSILFYRWANQRPIFRERLDRFKINMPVFGKLIRKAAVARFVRTFGDMITSGVVLMESLGVADKVAANKVISKIVSTMKDSIQRGGLISGPLEEQEIFPPTVVQMVAAGEESGELGFMLEKSAEGLDQDVDDTVKRLVVRIEPLMTLIMACLVGFIAVAIYMPIFDIIKQMGVH